jgi:hypothetical protein
LGTSHRRPCTTHSPWWMTPFTRNSAVAGSGCRRHRKPPQASGIPEAATFRAVQGPSMRSACTSTIPTNRHLQLRLSRGPFHQRLARSPQVPLREHAARAGFQVALECEGASLVSELDDHVNQPRPGLRRVRAAAGVVVGQPRAQVPGDTGVVAQWVGLRFGARRRSASGPACGPTAARAEPVRNDRILRLARWG